MISFQVNFNTGGIEKPYKEHQTRLLIFQHLYLFSKSLSETCYIGTHTAILKTSGIWSKIWSLFNECTFINNPKLEGSMHGWLFVLDEKIHNG
jgi:hypothetical protein